MVSIIALLSLHCHDLTHFFSISLNESKMCRSAADVQTDFLQDLTALGSKHAGSADLKDVSALFAAAFARPGPWSQDRNGKILAKFWAALPAGNKLLRRQLLGVATQGNTYSALVTMFKGVTKYELKQARLVGLALQSGFHLRERRQRMRRSIDPRKGRLEGFFQVTSLNCSNFAHNLLKSNGKCDKCGKYP